MNTLPVEPFNIIGISIRTTNEQAKAATDIPLLWQRFFSENILDQIPHKTSTDLYCVYTDYEKDHTRPYTTILGCRAEHLDDIPAGMTGRHIGNGTYTLFTAKGDLTAGVVFEEWTKIWNTALPRSYTVDFEVYGDKARDAANAEVAIFIAVHQ